MIARAEALGLTYFGTSEHVEFSVKDGAAIPDIDCEAYFSEALKRKAECHKTKYLIGIEFGFDERVQGSEYLKVERVAPVDYVISSVHNLSGVDCYWRESFEGKDKQQFYTEYLLTVLKSLTCVYRYEIVGHIGYISRNAPYDDPALRVAECSDILDCILKKIIDLDKTIELNTSTRTAGSITLPNLEVLARYYELGGRNITFASDAHNTDRIGDKYAEAAQIAKSIGFSYYDVYIDRQRKKVRI